MILKLWNYIYCYYFDSFKLWVSIYGYYFNLYCYYLIYNLSYIWLLFPFSIYIYNCGIIYIAIISIFYYRKHLWYYYLPYIYKGIGPLGSRTEGRNCWEFNCVRKRNLSHHNNFRARRHPWPDFLAFTSLSSFWACLFLCLPPSLPTSLLFFLPLRSVVIVSFLFKKSSQEM